MAQSPPITSDEFEYYLTLLGLEPEGPSINALTRVVAAHLRRFPFENISKLYHKYVEGRTYLPDLATYLDSAEKYNFGGTCYTNNYFINLLLNQLGYDARLCGADMSQPDVHVANIVTVDDREFIVDVGFGAPFYEPLPRDLSEDYRMPWGRDEYILRARDDRGRSRLDHHRDGAPHHGYRLNPEGRTIEHFRPAITHSYTDEASFMNRLAIMRFFEDHSLALRNLKLFRQSRDDGVVTAISSLEELPNTIKKSFGMPGEMVQQVTGILAERDVLMDGV